MTIKKLKSIDIINVLSDLVSEKSETTVKLPFMDLVVEYTKKRGIDRIMLITEREFPAYYFYQKNGFKEQSSQVVFMKEY